eukprot:8635994-Karenia_brevis.AAC.1
MALWWATGSSLKPLWMRGAFPAHEVSRMIPPTVPGALGGSRVIPGARPYWSPVQKHTGGARCAVTQ